MESPDETTHATSTPISMDEQFVSPEEIENEAETFFIEDDPEKALEKLLALSTNEDEQEKLRYVERLSELLDLIGENALNRLEEIISFIPKEKMDVKRAFLDQVERILAWLKKKEERGYRIIVDVILPIVFILMHSIYYDVKEKAAEHLATVAAILTQGDREKHLLPQILVMGHDYRNQENRAIVARLLNQLAPLFGRVICEKFIWAELRAMVEDSEARVRRESILHLPSTCKVISQEFFYHKLLPFYLRVCNDTDSEVRQACVEIIYDISAICSDDLTHVREVELTHVMLAFIKDDNQLVKIAAYKSLGPFISTLQRLKFDPKLIEHFITVANIHINRLGSESEVVYDCAYNFPAVVLTLGQNGWPMLAQLFHKLAACEARVRKPLACALHEIANLIGAEQAERDLLPVLVRFLKDPDDDIKFGVIQNLALFFKAFPSNKRENLIDILLELQKDQIKWRIRELIARQIGKFTLIFNPDTNFRIIAPISFKLCNDPVASVREEAAKNVYALFRALYRSGDEYKESTIRNIKGFSLGHKSAVRQSFVLMCRKLMKEPEIFREHFMENFQLVAEDKTPGVRIAIAKCLQKLYRQKNDLCDDPQIMDIVAKLKQDLSRDVRSVFESPEFQEISVDKQELNSIITDSKEKLNNSTSRLMKEKIEDLIDKSNRKMEFRDNSER